MDAKNKLVTRIVAGLEKHLFRKNPARNLTRIFKNRLQIITSLELKYIFNSKYAVCFDSKCGSNFFEMYATYIPMYIPTYVCSEMYPTYIPMYVGYNLHIKWLLLKTIPFLFSLLKT